MDLFTAYSLSLGIIFTSSTLKHISNRKNMNRLTNSHHLKDIKGNISLTKHFKVSTEELEKGVLLVAPSSAGKTTRFYKHLIKTINKGSIIMTEPSGYVSKSIVKQGYKVYKFNPFNLKETIGWNIFETAQSTYELRNLIRLLVETGYTNNCSHGDISSQKEWLQISETLIMSYALMNYHTKKYNMYTFVDNLLTKPIFAYPQGLNSFDLEQIQPDKNSIEYEIYEAGYLDAIKEFKQFLQCRSSTSNIIISVRTVLTSALKVFSIEEVAMFSRLKSFDFKRLRNENILLYIEIPEQYVNDLKPLTSTFIQQIINILFNYENESKEKSVYLFLDELGNLGELPRLSQTITQCRKYHISVIGALQSLAQLNKIYGDNETNLLLDAFQTKMVTGGLSTSNDYFVKLIGQTEKIDKTGNKIYTPIVTADNLREMPRNKVIIINGTHKPVKDTLLDYIPNDKVLYC